MNTDTIKVKINSLKNHLAHNPNEAQELAIYFYQAYLELSTEIQLINKEFLQKSYALSHQNPNIKYLAWAKKEKCLIFNIF